MTSQSCNASPPRVSVLMPMRNAERYLYEAALSVLSQDFADLELIVVDDGSTDRSSEIIRELGDPRVQLIPGPCSGFPAAWNTALGVASGEVVIECDSDDLLPPSRIGDQVAFLDEHPQYGAVCGGFSTIDKAGRHISALWEEDSTAQDITAELLGGITRTAFCTYGVRRAALVALGGMRTFFETGSDIDLQLRLAESCRIWYEPVERYRYRIHGSSITHTQASTRRQFYEQYARELRAQRAVGNLDDLQRERPRTAPDDASSPGGHRVHIQGMLTGFAWRTHREGRKLEAILLGFRAITYNPFSARAWRSVAALILKQSGPGRS